MIRWAMGLAAALAWAEPLLARSGSGAQADLTLGFGVFLDRDPDLTGTKASKGNGVSSLRFDLSSKTRTQEIELRFEADRFARRGTRSDAGLSYLRKTRSSLLSANLRSQNLPVGVVEDRDFTMDGFDAFDIAAGRSRLRIHSGSIALKTGLDRSVGVELSYGDRRRRTLAAILAQTTRYRVKAGLNLRVTSITEGQVFWEQLRLRSRGNASVSQRQNRLVVGGTYRPSDVLELGFDLGWRNLKAATTEQQGFEWRASLTHRKSNGKLFVRGSSEQTLHGQIIRVQLGLQRFVLQQKIELVAGLARLNGGTPEPTVSMRYAGDLSVGQLHVAASRDFVGSDETDEIRVGTKIDIDLTRAMGKRGSESMSFANSKTEATAQIAERSSGQIGASYHHKLRRDWGWWSARGGRFVRTPYWVEGGRTRCL